MVRSRENQTRPGNSASRLGFPGIDMSSEEWEDERMRLAAL
jgi:hypothetical protein